MPVPRWSRRMPVLIPGTAVSDAPPVWAVISAVLTVSSLGPLPFDRACLIRLGSNLQCLRFRQLGYDLCPNVMFEGRTDPLANDNPHAAQSPCQCTAYLYRRWGYGVFFFRFK